MATRLFSASKYGELQHNLAGARRLTVSTLGESHGLDMYLGAAIQYACWAHYHADIVFDHRTYANGGSLLAVGGTTTTGANGLTTQATQFAARPTDIAFIASGYNDDPSTAAAALTVATTVMGVADDLFAAGAKFVVVCGITPRGNPGPYMAYNQHIRNYCAATQGAIFLDVTSVLVDRQNAAGTMDYRDSGTFPDGTFGSWTHEGTHWSGHAVRQIAPLIADIFEKIVGVRTPRISWNAGNYDPVNAPYTNILGDAGNMMGTAGAAGGGVTGTIAGTSTASRLVISRNGTITADCAIVTGAGGERKQRITPGGTAVSGSPFLMVSCTPTITATNGGVASRKLDFEATIELTGVTGLMDVYLRPLASANDSMKVQSSEASRYPDSSSATLFARTLYPVAVPAGNNPAFNIIFVFDSGSNPAGTIDISRMSAMVVEE